jgi:hypothetical protein
VICLVLNLEAFPLIVEDNDREPLIFRSRPEDLMLLKIVEGIGKSGVVITVAG